MFHCSEYSESDDEDAPRRGRSRGKGRGIVPMGRAASGREESQARQKQGQHMGGGHDRMGSLVGAELCMAHVFGVCSCGVCTTRIAAVL